MRLLADAGTVTFFEGWKFTGSFTTVDLVAASTNALNGALLARRPWDRHERKGVRNDG